MNFKELLDNFNICYEKKSEPFCVFCGTPLFVLGGVCNKASTLTTVLSAGTAAAIAPNYEKYNFEICQSCENTIFSCALSELSSYCEQGYAKSLFSTLSELIKQLCKEPFGAQILFEHNTSDKSFHNLKGALICAVMLMLEKTDEVTELLASSDFFSKDAAGLVASMILKKNQVLLYHCENAKYMRYHLPIESKKIIVIKTEQKSSQLPLSFENVYARLLKNNPEILSPSQLDLATIQNDTSIDTHEKKLLCFLMHEEQRISGYPSITDEIVFYEMITRSGEELLQISENRRLSQLCDILSYSEGVLAYRPLSDFTGAYCIVNDASVDSFRLYCEREYEKKAGYKPAFYICDTVCGGGVRGIIR